MSFDRKFDKILREQGWGNPRHPDVAPASPKFKKPIQFPVVRRVFAGLIANEIVSIQPMSAPSGLLFYLDYQYGNPVYRKLKKAGLRVGQKSQ